MKQTSTCAIAVGRPQLLVRSEADTVGVGVTPASGHDPQEGAATSRRLSTASVVNELPPRYEEARYQLAKIFPMM